VHAPALIDAQVSSVVRGLTIAGKPNVQISDQRAVEMLTDDATFRSHPRPSRRHPRLPGRG